MTKNDFEQPIPSAAVPSQGLTLGEFHDDTANAVPLQSLRTILAPKPSNGTAPRTMEDAMADLQVRKVCLSSRPPLPIVCISVEVDGYNYKFGTLGSFSILKGKQKAGKSMVAIAIVAAAISGRPIGPFSVQLPLGRRRIQWPVEGQVNRLKTIKRQMYGRAGFELLRRRILISLRIAFTKSDAEPPKNCASSTVWLDDDQPLRPRFFGFRQLDFLEKGSCSLGIQHFNQKEIASRKGFYCRADGQTVGLSGLRVKWQQTGLKQFKTV